MKNLYKIFIVIGIISSGLIDVSAQTQTTTAQSAYMLERYVIGTGGIIGASSANYFHSATAGESVVGGSQNANYFLLSGFWHSADFSVPDIKKRYIAVQIPSTTANPTIDGNLNDAAWNLANPAQLLERGGVPEDWDAQWNTFTNNRVQWRAIWSKETNQLYIAIEIQDDVAGANDNDLIESYQDDCLELFTDGDQSGGVYNWPDHADAQLWRVRRDNQKYLIGETGAYTGSAISSAIQYGSKGDWTVEIAMKIYNTYDTNQKQIQEGNIIGWDVWYNDSDNKQQQDGKWLRDFQIGWGYTGTAYNNADYMHELEFGLQQSTDGKRSYEAVAVLDNFIPVIDGNLGDQAWQIANKAQLLDKGGAPENWDIEWNDFSNNKVQWQAVWSGVTNLLYVAIDVQDDVAGACDHPLEHSWEDDCFEIYTDGDFNGGIYNWPDHVDAQLWRIRRDNGKNLIGEIGAYTGSALTTAIQYGSKGNWTLEIAMEIYNKYDTNRKNLKEGDLIGWDIWYDDSDNTHKQDGLWMRDQQVGWGYTGTAYNNADYMHKLILAGVKTSTDENSLSNRQTPKNYALHQNYPNPFNPSTTIEFALPKSSFVTLKVYNLLGKEVATLIAEQRTAGIHKFNCDVNGLASGVYLYRLEVGNPSTSSGHAFVQIKKFILMR